MIKLAWSDLGESWRLWVGALVICVAAAFELHPVVVFFWSVANPVHPLNEFQGAPTTDDFLAIGTALATVYGLSAVIVLAVVVGIVGQLQAIQHATWRLSGASPAQVRRVISGQAVILGICGGGVGALLATPFSQTFLDLIMSTVPDGSLTAVHAPGPLGTTVLAILVISLLAAVGPARRASRVPAVEVLRDTPPRPPMGWGRWTLLGAVFLLILVPIVVAAVVPDAFTPSETLDATPKSQGTGNSMNDILSGGLGVGFGLLAVFAAGAPLLIRPILLGWTGLIGTERAMTWHLARASASARVATSTASVTPLMVAIGIVGLLLAMVRTSDALVLAETGKNLEAGADTLSAAITLVPPLAVAILGSFAALAMTSRRRENDMAVLRTQGATSRDMRWMLLLEAVICAITAAILAVIVILAQTLFTALLISRAGLPASLAKVDWGSIAAVGLVGLIGMIAVTLATGAPAIRRPAAQTLALIPE